MAPFLERLADMVAERTAQQVMQRMAATQAPLLAGEQLMDVEGAATYLSLSVSTIYKLSATGQLPKVKLGTRVRFRRGDLDEFVQQRQAGPGVVLKLARAVRAGRRR